MPVLTDEAYNRITRPRTGVRCPKCNGPATEFQTVKGLYACDNARVHPELPNATACADFVPAQPAPFPPCVELLIAACENVDRLDCGDLPIGYVADARKALAAVDAHLAQLAKGE